MPETEQPRLCGELLRQADRHISDRGHPHILAEGLENARGVALFYLNEIKTIYDAESMVEDRDLLRSIALTSVAAKLDFDSSVSLSETLVNSVLR